MGMKLDKAARAAVEKLAGEAGVILPPRRPGPAPGPPGALADAMAAAKSPWELARAAGHGGARFVVEINGWTPTRLNRLLNTHHMEAARLKKGDAEMLAHSLWAAGVTRAAGRRRVSMTVVLGPGQRGPDPDAFWKSTLDGLVQAGALTDDNRQGVELGPVRYVRGDAPATLLAIEDIVPEPKGRKGTER